MDDVETIATLIAGSKVSGTQVYNPSGENIGSIYDIMIDKRSGAVAYAVMSFGGFLGVGEDHHPLPWSKLNYSTALGGYVVDVSPEKLKASPAYSNGSNPAWGDREYEKRLHDYYGAGPYWGALI